MPYNANQHEQEILDFWEKDKTFEKSVAQRPEDKPYVFYDGPPFATGLPHYGHFPSSIMKDVVPRYMTMNGYRVERVWGWDCHGLPIENIVERELGTKSKKDIEALGVEKFNELCRSKVLGYVDEWKKTIRRLGRWVDMEHSYKTMDVSYMESVWWVFKQLWDKKLIYKGHRSMHVCPRCETTLSQQEVSEGYKDVKDISVVAKFRIQNSEFKIKYGIEGDLFVLAWTTTPWTLPGNVLLAVGEKIEYTLVKLDGSYYLLAKNLLMTHFEGKAFEVVAQLRGSDLVGLSYEPLFPYFADTQNAFRIVSADFVTTDEGTGVVHTAPGYGTDDYELGKKEDVGWVQHVGLDGRFIPAVADFAGQSVKPKNDSTATDVEIIKWLAHHDRLFAKQKIEHSYPHCWRCDTPLLNYATDSWFVSVTGVKERALELAKDINWSPEHIKEGRFGKWLEGARDWSISRQRFWASVIPVWECNNVRTRRVSVFPENTNDTKLRNGDVCENVVCVGSIDELRQKGVREITKILFVRHGESEKNVRGVKSRGLDVYPLTEKGENTTKLLANQIHEPVDVIISSPILRCRQTADFFQQSLGVDVVFDDLLLEEDAGQWEETTREQREKKEDYLVYKSLPLEEKYTVKHGVTGESREDIVKRTEEFLRQLITTYQGKTVLVVAHGCTNAAFAKTILNVSMKEYFDRHNTPHDVVETFFVDAEGREVDLHKHVVDKITFDCEDCGGVMRRVPDVLDTWFDSGSMPYAQVHYPFENKEKFEGSFPAQFIAEGQDQTRAWFYYLHIISTAIMDKPAYQNVIANGIVLAEDGKKMSKKLKNYPDPNLMLEKYGADAMRYYLLTSPVMLAENFNFSEEGLREVFNKLVNTLANVLSFYEMFASEEISNQEPVTSNNVLDRWILNKLHVLVQTVTAGLDVYNLPEASRPIVEFVNDLSTWWLRRSRDRFKGEDEEDKQYAIATLREVLLTLSKVMAPFTPFIAETMFQKMQDTSFKTQDELTSVHLETWPVANETLIDDQVLKDMEMVRKICEIGNALRKEAGIAVRQPLQKLEIGNLHPTGISDPLKLGSDLRELIIDELNVKELGFCEDVNTLAGTWVVSETAEVSVALNTDITDELKKEGILRELVRAINEKRKEQGLTRDNRIHVVYKTEDTILQSVFVDFADALKVSVLADDIAVGVGDEMEIDGRSCMIAVQKVV